MAEINCLNTPKDEGRLENGAVEEIPAPVNQSTGPKQSEAF